MTFRDKLLQATRNNDSLLCIGLDPTPEQLPSGLSHDTKGICEFNRAIIAATADLVCAYKPNLAFYEALGPAGLEALLETRRLIPSTVPVIGDAKRGDIGNTAERYARALFEVYNFDAVTVSPYLGRDALEPFLSRADRGVFILCRTSNPGAVDFQDALVSSDDSQTGERLYELVARRTVEWNERGNAGLVVGATYPSELARVRGIAPDVPILIPGVGAQQGALEDAVRSGVDRNGELAVINAARQVLYASSGSDFATEARRVALQLRETMNRNRVRSGE